MSLKRNRRGSFILRFRSGGRGSELAYHNLGPITRDEAKERAGKLQGEARRRLALAEPGITFADLFDTWKRIVGLGLADATLKSSETQARAHILPAIGHLPVESLLPVTIENYRADRLAEKKPPAPSSLNHEITVLRWILNFGEENGIVRNPIPRGRIKPLKYDLKTVYFQPEEWRAFIAAADSDEELRVAAPLWRLQLLTASRLGEIVDLRWSAVDFERGFIAIGQKKTGRTKAFTLTPAMRAALAPLTRGIGEAHVFTDAAGLPWEKTTLNKRFARTLRAAGLVGDWTPHSIRHTAATWARKAGMPLDRVAKMLGHAGLGLVLRYAHFATEDLDLTLDAVSAMEKRIGERTVIETGDFGQAGIEAAPYSI
ncbi:MAG TPA: site-specific integrase [Polyangiaceae bacterium]